MTLVCLSHTRFINRCHRFEKAMEARKGDFINRFINKGREFYLEWIM